MSHGRQNIEARLLETNGCPVVTRTIPVRGRGAPGSLAHDRERPRQPQSDIDAIIRGADLVDAAIWASKYVMDESVIDNCWARLIKFWENQTIEFRTAITQITEELK